MQKSSNEALTNIKKERMMIHTHTQTHTQTTDEEERTKREKGVDIESIVRC